MMWPETICLTGSSTFLRLTVVYSRKSNQSANRSVNLLTYQPIIYANLKKNKDKSTYRYLRSLEQVFGDVSLSQLDSDGLLHLADELPVELAARSHQQEQHDALVDVLRSPLPHADGVRDPVREVPLDDRVDLRGAEADAARVQDAVGPAEEGDPFGDGMHNAEVTVGPL